MGGWTRGFVVSSTTSQIVLVIERTTETHLGNEVTWSQKGRRFDPVIVVKVADSSPNLLSVNLVGYQPRNM